MCVCVYLKKKREELTPYSIAHHLKNPGRKTQMRNMGI